MHLLEGLYIVTKKPCNISIFPGGNLVMLMQDTIASENLISLHDEDVLLY